MPDKKRVADSEVSLHQFMLPQHANPLGNVHGGIIMKLVDEAGGLCAMRHAQRPAVTIAIDSMTFHSPVHVGNLLTLKASIHYVGNTSMEVGVRVTAENPITGEQTHTNSARLVYVALDDNGRATKVPGLILENDTQRRRWDAAKERQAERLRREKE
ncbi:MAG TPA: acyl-CoA thioesterase [Chloroflexi bacterium]|nr:acyl-CoA thioesterase [Chloroflexota bacterium]